MRKPAVVATLGFVSFSVEVNSIALPSMFWAPCQEPGVLGGSTLKVTLPGLNGTLHETSDNHPASDTVFQFDNQKY